ncbi:MAG: hypothetical protein Ct9H300mP1_30370 [Planctomycetaceae bacterium]|nr:MAG: hypothetical protein Ct9H300mP1_30370 [Planctomycetaceae bacterium]
MLVRIRDSHQQRHCDADGHTISVCIGQCRFLLSVSWRDLRVRRRRGPPVVSFLRTENPSGAGQQCYLCHSARAATAGKLKGKLRLDTRAGTRAGGESGPAVVPGKPGDSPLVERCDTSRSRCPPKGEIAGRSDCRFVTWIKMGAPDPRDGDAKVESHRIWRRPESFGHSGK